MVQWFLEFSDMVGGVYPKDFNSKFFNMSVNKHGVAYGTSLRILKGEVWINSIYLYGWFQWYF